MIATNARAAPRLCVGEKLVAGRSVALSPDQANYLLNVLRLRAESAVRVFNGRDGEFAAKLELPGKRGAGLRVGPLMRPQEAPPDVEYLFAPLKHARMDYLVQKAVEMGASRLWPVITRRTQTQRINAERMRANVREAAEQCDILWLAEVEAERPLAAMLANWPDGRTLVFCDEEASSDSKWTNMASLPRPGAVSVIVGPEGGFDEEERAAILGVRQAVRLSLGPRVLRADTAAVAALTLVQALWGDWR